MTNKITNQLNTPLPDTLHGLLELALNDLELCEKDPDYDIDMLTWHFYDYDEESNREKPQCIVCMVGAILAKTCNIPIDHNIADIGLSDYDNAKKFQAIDWLRSGDVSSAYRILNDSHSFSSLTESAELMAFNRCIKPYCADVELNKKQLRTLVNVLKEASL